MTLPDFLGRLDGVVRNGSGTVAKCPAHDDHKQSLSITTGRDDRLLLKCHAGCPAPTIVDALGLTMADLFADRGRRRNGTGSRDGGRIVATYDYRDEAGSLLFQTVRLEPKDFRQRRPTGSDEWAWNLKGVRLVLYRLDQLATTRPPRVVLVEGEKDVDRLVALGIAATTSPMGAGKWRPEYAAQLQASGIAEVILTPDHDPPGRQHMTAVGQSVTAVGLRCRWLELPGLPEKGDLTDWLAAGGDRAQLLALADQAPAWPLRSTLDQVHAIFQKWLGATYDLDVLDAVLAVAATERLNGDPPWLLVISGPGDAKTETIAALEGAGAVVVSTIASEGALLSASSQRTRTKDATGGLLRQLGDRGLLAIKDVTSLLSSNGNTRPQVLAALREVYDGRWVRNVGTDGGRTLSWSGRLVVLGAVTTAWDTAHAVIAAMGDRFLLVRADSTQDRQAKSRQARKNIGQETTMRAELAAAVGSLLTGVNPQHTHDLADADWTLLEAVADLVTLARTAVEADYRGDPVEAHAPEVPTRFLKQLGQLMRGATALGLSSPQALRLALRVARDCVPPARLAVLHDVKDHPDTKATETRHRLDKPRNTVVRLLDALHALHLLTCKEYEAVPGKPWLTVLTYRLAKTVDRGVLERLPMSGNLMEWVLGVGEVLSDARAREETPPIGHKIPGQPEPAGYPESWDDV